MANIKDISFENAIKISDKNNRSLLLGNGFSISLCESFDYKYLYKEALNLSETGKVSISKSIKRTFDELGTYDFEKVLAYLNIAIRINEHYPNGKLQSALKEDRTNLVTSFMTTINSVHPRYKKLITNQTYISCLKLLSKFNKIFTTNYDVLLYWIIMERNSSILRLNPEWDDDEMSYLPIDDGFTRNRSSGLLMWDSHYKNREQKIFYLHGSLFIINAGGSYLKLENNNEETILDKLEKTINSEQQPLIVLEGSSEHKADKIGGHAYLRYCLNTLKNLNEDLFLLGFSINDKSDNHIIESIQESHVKRVFIGSPQRPNEAFKKRIKLLGHMNNCEKERELFIFNSKDAIKWNAIQEDGRIESDM